MMNKGLAGPDIGGYEIHYDQPLAKLITSDVKVGRKYKDRLENNRENTKVSNSMILNLTKYPIVLFIFRVIFISWRTISSYSLSALAKVNCICQEYGYGCVIILTVVHLDDWSHQSNLFTHEFGHVLGAEHHDDHFYIYTPLITRSSCGL